MSVKIIVRSCSRMTSYLSPYEIHSNKSRQYWRGFKFASNEPLRDENTGALYKQFKFQNEPWKITIRDFLKIFGLWIAINNFRSTSRWKSVRRGKIFFLISSYFFHFSCTFWRGLSNGGWVGGLFEYDVVANGLYSFWVDCREAMNIAKEGLITNITDITDSKRSIYFCYLYIVICHRSNEHWDFFQEKTNESGPPRAPWGCQQHAKGPWRSESGPIS